MIPPSSRLRRAILLNDVLLVQRIIRNHPRVLENPDFDDQSNTSLHLAAMHGFAEVAASLIAAGHDAHEISRNAAHDTPLMLAARHGHVDVGRLLIVHFPACILFANKTGHTALSLAATSPAATPLLAALLAHPTHPASPHAADAEGNTPLHHASAAGSLKALRLLLAAGASPLAKNHYDWAPLAYSQTVAAEVYFKNLIAECERRKQDDARRNEEREKARAAGLRLVEDESGSGAGAASSSSSSSRLGAMDDDELIGDALKRHWSPVDRKRPGTPGSLPRHEWGAALTHARTRSGS